MKIFFLISLSFFFHLSETIPICEPECIIEKKLTLEAEGGVVNFEGTLLHFLSRSGPVPFLVYSNSFHLFLFKYKKPGPKDNIKLCLNTFRMSLRMTYFLNLSVGQNLPFLDLPKMAKGNGKWQMWQCIIRCKGPSEKI